MIHEAIFSLSKPSCSESNVCRLSERKVRELTSLFFSPNVAFSNEMLANLDLPEGLDASLNLSVFFVKSNGAQLFDSDLSWDPVVLFDEINESARAICQRVRRFQGVEKVLLHFELPMIRSEFETYLQERQGKRFQEVRIRSRMERGLTELLISTGKNCEKNLRDNVVPFFLNGRSEP